MRTALGYSSNPLHDANRHLDEMARRDRAQQQAEAQTIQDFMTACQRGDANAIAGFSYPVQDWQAVKKPRLAGAPIPTRMQTLAEVLEDALDYQSGPSKTELMQLVLNLAFSAECQAVQSQRARQLLASAADAWARNNVVVDA